MSNTGLSNGATQCSGDVILHYEVGEEFGAVFAGERNHFGNVHEADSLG